MTKKTLIIVIAVVVIGLLVWFGFSYLKSIPQPGTGQGVFGTIPLIGRQAQPQTPPSGTQAPSTLTGQTAQTPPTLLQAVNADVFAPTLSADAKSLFYIARENGHLKQSDLDGRNETTISNLTVLDTFDAVWSPKKTKLVIRYADNAVVKTFLDELATATPSRVLPQEVTAEDWSPDGSLLGFLSRQNNTTNLILTDDRLRNQRTVYSSPVPDLTLKWLGKNSLLLISNPSGLAPSLVLKFDTNTRQTQTLLSGRQGLTALPLPDATGFIFSDTTSQGQLQGLWQYKLAGGTVSRLNIMTLAEKCAFDKKGTGLFCAVPQNSISGVMPDDWYRGKVSFSDGLVSIDLKTGATKTYDLQGTNADIINLFLTPDSQYIFFQDKKTGNIWRVTL